MHYDLQNLDTKLTRFNDTVMCEFKRIFDSISVDTFAPALDMILETEKNGGRVHITGIGKPHHVSQYLASLFSSTGTPAYFLDGTEATHGSSGQVKPGDVVIAISYYGDVAELNRTVVTLKSNGAKLIAMTGFDNSFIAKYADVHINCFVAEEGDELNRAPRTSMLATLWMGMALSLLLQEIKGLTLEQYLHFHPSGILGKEKM